MNDLSSIPLEDLLDELRRRCTPATVRGVQSPPDILRPWTFPKQPEVPPQATVETIPGQFKRDGSPRKLITPGGNPLDPTDDHRSPDEIIPGSYRYIVKGEEREALARSFIDQWEAEIVALRLEAAELYQGYPDDEETPGRIEAIDIKISILKENIRLRSDSAFNNMSFSEVQARNEQQNPGRVSLVVGRPGIPGEAPPVEVVTGIPAFDTPAIICFEATMPPGGIYDLLKSLGNDPFRDSRGLYTLKTPEGTNPCGLTKFTMPAEPTLAWRITALCQRLFFNQGKEVRDDAMAFLRTWTDMIYTNSLWEGFVEPPYLLTANPAEDFRLRVLHYLNDYKLWNPTEEQERGLIRTIRIFDVDFKEREIPDEWFHQTDPENLLGVQLQPHINPRSAWKEK